MSMARVYETDFCLTAKGDKAPFGVHEVDTSIGQRPPYLSIVNQEGGSSLKLERTQSDNDSLCVDYIARFSCTFDERSRNIGGDWNASMRNCSGQGTMRRPTTCHPPAFCG